jgi:uncharacterized protein YaaN involved in tellurite resistance
MDNKNWIDNTNPNPLAGLGAGMVNIGVGAALIGLLGGMMKMFGNDEKTPQKLAEEMMAGAIRGILEHFEYKIDELKRDNERKAEEIGQLKERAEQLQEMITKTEAKVEVIKAKKQKKAEKTEDKSVNTAEVPETKNE